MVQAIVLIFFTSLGEKNSTVVRKVTTHSYNLFPMDGQFHFISLKKLNFILFREMLPYWVEWCVY